MEIIKSVKLSDGREAKVRRPKGRDLVRAQDLAQGDNRYKFACALLAQITTIDGRAVVMEDVQELYSSDIDLLSTEARADFLAPTAESSPGSSNGDLGSRN